MRAPPNDGYVSMIFTHVFHSCRSARNTGTRIRLFESIATMLLLLLFLLLSFLLFLLFLLLLLLLLLLFLHIERSSDRTRATCAYCKNIPGINKRKQTGKTPSKSWHNAVGKRHLPQKKQTAATLGAYRPPSARDAGKQAWKKINKSPVRCVTTPLQITVPGMDILNPR